MSNPFEKDLKKFSVVAPVYKQAYKTLEKFFSHLNEQDYRAFEVIVVFDGKHTRGVKELERVSKKYPKISVIHDTIKHGGAPKARNHGASLATGDFYTFLDPDVYLYPATLRQWANAFEEHPDKDVVWGLYDIETDGQTMSVGGQVPIDGSGKPDYWAFRFSNYASGANPMRKEAFVGWDETCISLQDWDMWQRTLLKTDWKGDNFYYIPKSFFVTEAPYAGGISDDSHKNWKERSRYVRRKNGVPDASICVTSLGAPFHGLHAAKKLEADYLPMPSFKPHDYKKIYLLGYYPTAMSNHEKVFENFEGTKIIHWIGTDIFQMQWKIPFKTMEAMKKHFKEKNYKMLVEAEHTYHEMAEMGINTTTIPLPPQELYEPMPLPEKFTVAVYENATQQMYGEELMQEVARAMPDIEFKFFGDETKKGLKYENTEHLGWIDIEEKMPEFSCNLRMTVHDGLPITPVQFLTAGRPVVTNVPLKYSIQAEKNRKDVVAAIRKAQKEGVQTKASVYWKKQLDFRKFKKNIERL